MRMLRNLVVGLALFLLVGNLLILGAHAWAKGASPAQALSVEGIANFRAVDDVVWRGAAPSTTGYRSLIEHGVATIVDVRAEAGLAEAPAFLGDAGVEVHHLPIRDGQTPTEGDVTAFLDIVRQSPGPVFLHCGAGVGRTGAMVAAYLAATSQSSGAERVRNNLAVGPPSLEQIAYAANLGRGDFSRPHVAVVAASRVLDAPRRIIHQLGF